MPVLSVKTPTATPRSLMSQTIVRTEPGTSINSNLYCFAGLAVVVSDSLDAARLALSTPEPHAAARASNGTVSTMSDFLLNHRRRPALRFVLMISPMHSSYCHTALRSKLREQRVRHRHRERAFSKETTLARFDFIQHLERLKSHP